MPPPPGKGKNAPNNPKPEAIPGDKVDLAPETTETESADPSKEELAAES